MRGKEVSVTSLLNIPEILITRQSVMIYQRLAQVVTFCNTPSRGRISRR